MATPGVSETETVVKRILPYLRRRGYDIDKDLVFELPSKDGASTTFVDIGVQTSPGKLAFLLEAKRQSHRLSQKDRNQALAYARIHNVPFVVVTNGVDLEILNASTGEPIRVTEGRAGRSIVPHKTKLASMVKKMKANPAVTDFRLDDDALPFRPGLPLKQLNALFARCHSKIRSLEKNEDNAFEDFSKFLFLRLLEEKADDPTSNFSLPYSTRFYDLAAHGPARHDEVKTLVDNMIEQCRKQYGDVITAGLNIRQASTYSYLVTELSKVSFTDSGLDTKGAAFEYFVRATLKGKKLGQYFTPRNLVELMLEMVGSDLILGTLMSGQKVKVIDPACGTGGFLVFLMKHVLEQIDQRQSDKKITPGGAAALRKSVKEEVFYGIDANQGVASSAKMNMIISGDGHTNISCFNSLAADAPLWSMENPEYDLVISNPPFGTSESDLPADDLALYETSTKKGQLLFLEKMIRATKRGGTICTVIDDGALNTGTASATRKWILENARLRAVVSLPASTFKPNKITVKSSVLLLERIDVELDDPEDDYDVTYVSLNSLGFHPSGEQIRGFDFEALKRDFASLMRGSAGVDSGDHWRSFTVKRSDISEDVTCRFDFKYWDESVRDQIAALRAQGAKTISEINMIETARGVSPQATTYVDPEDGYAMVLKAGTSVTNFGAIVDSGDWLEKDVYDEKSDAAKVSKYDVLLSSTGDGTLGKCGVYEGDEPALADGHITIIRVDPTVLDPHFLADYLRAGFGRVQTHRLFTGSTGLIELTPDDAARILVPTFLSLEDQRKASTVLRRAEGAANALIHDGRESLEAARKAFAGFDGAGDDYAEVEPSHD